MNKTRSLLLATFGLLAASILPTKASAATVTFVDAPPFGTVSAPFTDGGLVFTGGTLAGYPIVSGQVSLGNPNVNLLEFNGNASTPFTITAANGGLFNLTSLSIAEEHGTSPSAVVTAYNSLGGVIATDMLAFRNASLQVDSLIGFTNVSDVTITANSGQFGITNLDYNTPAAVPLPPTIALLASGVIGMGLFGRRKLTPASTLSL